MAVPTRPLNGRPLLGWPAFVVAAALVVYALPGAGAALVYDRAAILDGEVWRLVTGHWVHFSASHLFYDVAVLGVTGWLIGSLGYGCFPALCLLSAVSIGLVLLVFVPGMANYGGLSGIAMASTVYLALRALHEPRPWGGAASAVLLVCIGKMVIELLTGHYTVMNVDPELVVPVPASHLVGAASGVAVYLWSRINRLRLAKRPAESSKATRAIIGLAGDDGVEQLLGRDS
jgi:rhomboid family GlyGly-CTERM serine protease